MTEQSSYDTLVTVIGGSGFLGRNVVRALAQRVDCVRISFSRPDVPVYLHAPASVSQILAAQSTAVCLGSVASFAQGAHFVITLCGILFERGRYLFDSVQAAG